MEDIILRRFSAQLAIVLILALFSNLACAQDNEKTSKALEVILNFAKNLCETEGLSLAGRSSREVAITRTKASLGGLIEKIAHFGYQRSTRLEKEEYVGVLQADLAPLLKGAK